MSGYALTVCYHGEKGGEREMSDTIVVGILTFIASIVSAASVSIGNRNKTIEAVKEELRGVREESKATDQEMHADILLFKQETSGALELIRKDISTLSDRVEKHNSVIERVFKLEQGAAVMEEKQRVANHRIEDLEKANV